MTNALNVKKSVELPLIATDNAIYQLQKAAKHVGYTLAMMQVTRLLETYAKSFKDQSITSVAIRDIIAEVAEISKEHAE